MENATELLKHIKINDYVIELKRDKQPLFKSNNNLGPMILETLKT